MQLSAHTRQSVKPAQQLGCYQHAGQLENKFVNHFNLIVSITVWVIGKNRMLLICLLQTPVTKNSMYLFGIQGIENCSTKCRIYKSAVRTLWKEVVIKLRPAYHSNSCWMMIPDQKVRLVPFKFPQKCRQFEPISSCQLNLAEQQKGKAFHQTALN